MNPQPPPVPPEDVPPSQTGPSSPPPPLAAPSPSFYYEPPVTAPSSRVPGALKAVGIGCGVLTLIGVIIGVWTLVWGAGKLKKFVENPERLIAEMVLKGQPDVEFVKSDSASKTVTVRDKASGEEMTMSFEDIRQGRFKMTKPDGSTAEITPQGLKVTDANGTVTMAGGPGNAGDPPVWLPLYPRPVETRLSTRTEKTGGTEGVYIFVTDDSIPIVMKTYESILRDMFSGVTAKQVSMDGVERGEFSGTRDASGAGQQKITGNVVRLENQTMVTLQYEETAK